ncbi:MAG: hypothetical protein ACRD0Q_07890 [Acidimicrobiales bacterium]
MVFVVVYVALPLLLVVVDIGLVVFLAIVGLVARLVLRRPWTVEAIADDGSRLVWRVVGWRASGDQVAGVSAALAAGQRPPPTPRPAVERGTHSQSLRLK